MNKINFLGCQKCSYVLAKQHIYSTTVAMKTKYALGVWLANRWPWVLMYYMLSKIFGADEELVLELV